MCCKLEFSYLLQQLAENYPICALIPFSLEEEGLLNELCSRTTQTISNVSKVSYILNKSPFLGHLLTHLAASHLNVLIPIVKQMRIVLRSTFVRSEHTILKPPTTDNLLSQFPAMPKLSERGVYASDVSNERYTRCVKEHQKKKIFSPGLLHMSCVHGGYLTPYIFS